MGKACSCMLAAPEGMQGDEHPSPPPPLSPCPRQPGVAAGACHGGPPVWGRAWLQTPPCNCLPRLLSADNKTSCDVLMSSVVFDNCRVAELTAPAGGAGPCPAPSTGFPASSGCGVGDRRNPLPQAGGLRGGPGWPGPSALSAPALPCKGTWWAGAGRPYPPRFKMRYCADVREVATEEGLGEGKAGWLPCFALPG